MYERTCGERNLIYGNPLARFSFDVSCFIAWDFYRVLNADKDDDATRSESVKACPYRPA